MPVETFRAKCCGTMRLRRFSYRTEQMYPPAIEHYIAFRDGRTRSAGQGERRKSGLTSATSLRRQAVICHQLRQALWGVVRPSP